MTAQIPDTFIYQGRDRALVGIDGTGLFEPEPYGLSPVMMSTACWRGFVCTYRVEQDALHLERVHLRLEEAEHEAALRGERPLFGVQPGAGEYGELHYEGLGVIPFTGGLLLGDGFIQELYEHMGFPPAWKFEEVHELLFEEGRLTEARDRSEEIAGFRAGMSDAALGPEDPLDEESVRSWIERTFRRDYRW